MAELRDMTALKLGSVAATLLPMKIGLTNEDVTYQLHARFSPRNLNRKNSAIRCALGRFAFRSEAVCCTLDSLPGKESSLKPVHLPQALGEQLVDLGTVASRTGVIYAGSLTHP